MIGTTRSRVSFFMNKFRKLGFISYNGKSEINSSLLNAVLYDKPEIKRRIVKRKIPQGVTRSLRCDVGTDVASKAATNRGIMQPF